MAPVRASRILANNYKPLIAALCVLRGSVKALVIIILVSLTFACKSGKDLSNIKSNDLIGVWTLKYSGESSYPYHFSQLAFMANGDKCILSYSSNFSGEFNVAYYKSTYEVIDGILISTVSYSSGEFALPKGYLIKDKLIHYDESSFNVLMIKPEGDSPENHQKLVGVNPNEICEVVERYRENSEEIVASST